MVANASSQAGVFAGLNPASFNASDPIVLFIIQVCKTIWFNKMYNITFFNRQQSFFHFADWFPYHLVMWNNLESYQKVWIQMTSNMMTLYLLCNSNCWYHLGSYCNGKNTQLSANHFSFSITSIFKSCSYTRSCFFLVPSGFRGRHKSNQERLAQKCIDRCGRYGFTLWSWLCCQCGFI